MIRLLAWLLFLSGIALITVSIPLDRFSGLAVIVGAVLVYTGYGLFIRAERRRP